jgi:hypothetical protein
MLSLAPGVALATGPSAGDNQYTDPLKSITTAHTTPAPTTTSAPPQTTAPPPVAPTSTPITPPASATASTAPTATTSDPSASLPRTGYNGWLAALLGAGLVAAGAGIRLRFTDPR